MYSPYITNNKMIILCKKQIVNRIKRCYFTIVNRRYIYSYILHRYIRNARFTNVFCILFLFCIVYL
jgi:hypothetical protein